jgi:hypothetical protein
MPREWPDYYPGEYQAGDHSTFIAWLAPNRAGKTYLQSRLLAELADGPSPVSFLRAWRGLVGSTTNLQRDPDAPYDPADDRPFTVIDIWPTDYPDYWVHARKLADLKLERHRSSAPAESRARVRW